MTDLTGTFHFYKSWKRNQARSANLDTDSFQMLLCGSLYEPDRATHTQSSDISDEVVTSGYARQALENVAWGDVDDLTVFSFDPVVFEAPDEDIQAKYWVVVDTTVDALVCYGLLSSNGSPVTIEEGNDMTISFEGGAYALRDEDMDE